MSQHFRTFSNIIIAAALLQNLPAGYDMAKAPWADSEKWDDSWEYCAKWHRRSSLPFRAKRYLFSSQESAKCAKWQRRSSREDLLRAFRRLLRISFRAKWQRCTDILKSRLISEFTKYSDWTTGFWEFWKRMASLSDDVERVGKKFTYLYMYLCMCRNS